MGSLERSFIRLLEPLLNRTSRSNKTSAMPGSQIKLGVQAAPYGRQGNAPCYLRFTDFLTHINILGASGTGKTCLTLVLCVAMLLASRGFMVIDCHDAVPKLLAIIADLIIKSKLDHSIINRFIVLSFSYNDWILRFNPIPHRDRFGSTNVAMQLTEIILNSGTNMQMGPATAELVRNCFILLSDRGLSFNMTERLMVDDLFLRHHASQCTHGQCRDYFIHRHLRKSAAQRRVYTEAFLTRISIFLADPRIRAMLSSGENDLDLRRAMDEGKIVLIDINKGQLSENARLLGGMFLLSLQHAALSRTDIPENERQPWTAFVDEHQSLASSVALQPLLNETRKFGIGLVLASQTYASMDKTLIQNIQTNCAHQIYFRLSADDASLGTAGLIGEERELAKRQIVQLPVATALMSRYGQRLERIKINRCDIPENLTDEHLDIIRQIRQSAGVALTEALNEPNIAENDTPPASSYEPVQEEQDITREDDERDDFIEGEYE